MMRAYFPRVFAEMAPMAKLPPMRSLHGAALAGAASQMVGADFVKAFDAIYKAGQESAKWMQITSTADDEFAALGFVNQHQAAAMAPFDVISDNIRGMRGSMVDMYRRPEQLLKLCEMYVQQSIDMAVNLAGRKKGNPKRVFMALHRGAEGFMSNKQFEKFYWPTLKKVMLALIDKGLVPFPYFEGEYSSRLEYLLELPKGKVICHFAYIDLPKAKAILGGHQCIVASVPSSMLVVSSAQEIEEYTRNLIKQGGKGGGFMLTNGTVDEPVAANMKAIVDAAKKYGAY
jgi:uroporphyrinogen-III decarboxylase